MQNLEVFVSVSPLTEAFVALGTAERFTAGVDQLKRKISQKILR